MADSCETCRFFESHGEGSDTGECRGDLPQFVPIMKGEDGWDSSDRFIGCWPIVSTDAWCRWHELRRRRTNRIGRGES